MRLLIICAVCACGARDPQRTKAAQGGPTGPTGPATRVDPTFAQPLQPLRPAGASLDAVVRTAASSYCGGAQVDPDFVPPPPLPARNQAVVVVSGDYYHDGAPAAAVTTAADGTFTAALTPGRYCVVLAPRGPKPPANTCELAEWEYCTAVVDVPVANVVAVDYFTPCWSRCDPPASPPP